MMALGASLSAGAQTGLQQVLDAVERNNPSLAAAGHTVEAQKLEARSANNLPDPFVTYDRMWGSPKELGKVGEVNVVQDFDFPTQYVARSRQSTVLATQYDAQYAAVRKEILLAAQMACIEIVALRKKGAVLDEQVAINRNLAQACRRKVDAGHASALELTKIELELASAENAQEMNLAELSAAENELRKLAGGAEVAFADTDYGMLSMLPPMDDMISRWLEADPQIRASLSGCRAAEQQTRVTKGGSLPKLQIGYRGEIAEGERFNGIKMGLSVPIFSNRSNVKRAKAEESAARERLRQERLQTEADIRELYAREDILHRSEKRYTELIIPKQTKKMLDHALESGEIAITDYYDQLASIYEVRHQALDIEMQHRLVHAQILSIGL